MRRSLLPIALLTACAEATDDDAADDQAITSTVVLASTLGFAGAEDGISEGFDLDDAVTSSGDATGCGHADFEAPDGTPGIDNSFAGMLPIIESTGGQALPELVQNAVFDGELLIMLEAHGLEQAEPGDCIEVDVIRGLGMPEIGGHGEILPGQTFDKHPDFPRSTVDCARVDADGVLTGDDFSYRLPLQVFDESIDLTLHGGHFRMEPTDDGWTGAISGGVEAAELAANVQSFDGIPEVLISTVASAVDLRTDLAPDDTGTCTQLSVVLSFGGVSAWLFADDDE